MYNIESLAELSGLTKRTVRYYIQLGLLTPPIGSCRGSYYTESHLNRLEQIKRLSGQGIPLSQMKAIISAESPKSASDFVEVVNLTQWNRAMICDDVELSFKQDYLSTHDLNRIVEFIRDLVECRDNN